MPDTHRILIVEHQEDWLTILRRAFPEGEFEVESAHTYHEAICALETQSFDLTVIDPAPNHPAPEDHPERQEGLKTVADIVKRFPKTHLVVLSSTVDQKALQSSPEIPNNLPVFDKSHWDRTGFRRVVNRLLNGAEAVEPEITPPPESVLPPEPFDDESRYPRTGLTGPLKSGLIPPP